MDDLDEMQKRTKKMREELKRKVQEHERASRANQAIVVALYSWSFHYTKKINSARNNITQPETVLSDVRDIFAPEEKTGEDGPQMPELVIDFKYDDGLLLDDKW